MKRVLLLCTTVILSVIGVSVTAEAATLIGQTLRHQCPECAPPLDESFVVVSGSPELTPFSQYEVDVAASSIRIEWLDTSFRIDPGHFVFSGFLPQFPIASAVFDLSGTWTPVGLTFTADSVTIDFSGQTTTAGTYALINLTSVPEPSTFGLACAIAALLVTIGLRRTARS